MLEYLAQLLREQEWFKAIACAEQLLRSHGVSQRDIIRIYSSLCEARFSVGDYQGAVVAGQLAVEHAERLGTWDPYGEAWIALSAVYVYVGKVQRVEEALSHFLEHLGDYSEAIRRLEFMIWFNYGRACLAAGDAPAAVRAYNNSVRIAERYYPESHIHLSRQYLIEAYLKAGDLKLVPRLLAQCGKYVRNYTNANGSGARSRLMHIQQQVEYALATGRYRRARLLALKGLENSDQQPRQQFSFHMIMARMAESKGEHSEAVGHLLAARVHAMQCLRPDLESEATQFLCRVVTDHPDSVEATDEYYVRV